MSNERYVIGIDLGTTNSAVAKLNEFGKPETILNGLGERITPSVIQVKDGLESMVVGSDAKRAWKESPELTIIFIKRQIRNNDAYERPWFPGGKDPSFYSGVILKHLVKEALPEDEPDMTIADVDAVITVPANYGPFEKERVMSAARQAGLNVLMLLNEPTAAAVAYASEKKLSTKEPQTILVYDLGGGTFDVTILKATPKANTDDMDYEVLVSEGVERCGGRDWDYEIASLIVSKYNQTHGTDYSLPLDEEDMLTGEYSDEVKRLYADLMIQAEEIKKKLTDSAKRAKPEERKVSVALKPAGLDEKVEFELTNDEFDEMTRMHLDKTLQKVDSALENVSKRGIQVDKWILVGGSSRMPQVKEALEKKYGCQPIVSKLADEIVAMGAAIVANRKKGGESVPKDILTSTYGTGCLLRGTDTEIIENIVFTGDKLPCDGETTLETVVDNQTAVKQNIYESKFKRTEGIEGHPGCILKDEGNLVLEKKLPFTKPMPKGTPITVHYHVDESGLLTMTATGPDGSRIVGQVNASVGAIDKKAELAGQRIIDQMETYNSR